MLNKTLYVLIMGSAVMLSACGKGNQQQVPPAQPLPPQNSITSDSSIAIPTAPQQQMQQAMPTTTMATNPVSLEKDDEDDKKPAVWLRIGVSNKIVASVDKNSIEKNTATKQVKAKIKHEFPHADFTVRDTSFNKEYKYKSTISTVTVDCQTKQYKVTKTRYFDANNQKVFVKKTKEAPAKPTGKDNFSSLDIQTGLCK